MQEEEDATATQDQPMKNTTAKWKMQTFIQEYALVLMKQATPYIDSPHCELQEYARSILDKETWECLD